jgi:hypothetical protein
MSEVTLKTIGLMKKSEVSGRLYGGRVIKRRRKTSDKQRRQ